MKPDAPTTYPCRDCGGSMRPTEIHTPAGRRYQCDTCTLSAPRTYAERHPFDKYPPHKRAQSAHAIGAR